MAKVEIREDGLFISGGKVTVENGKYSFEIGGKKFVEAESKAPEYRKVTDRKPKVGDYVKFSVLANSIYEELVTIGSYYKVLRIDNVGDLRVYDNNEVIYDTCGDDFEVYEKVSQEIPKEEPLKVGDYAKVQQYTEYKRIADGTIVEIKEARNGGFAIESFDGKSAWVYTDELVRATDAEVADAKRKLAPRPTVGNFVKVVKITSGHSAKIGDIVYITEDNRDEQPFRCEDLTGKWVGWLYASEVELIDGEELAEAERKLAVARVAAKYAKIGRKVNEFKVGDIVRVTNGSDSILRNGDIGEIAEIGTDNVPYRVNTSEVTSGNWVCADDIELITPVEQRFDL